VSRVGGSALSVGKAVASAGSMGVTIIPTEDLHASASNTGHHPHQDVVWPEIQVCHTRPTPGVRLPHGHFLDSTAWHVPALVRGSDNGKWCRKIIHLQTYGTVLQYTPYQRRW
jgi:hypothetical protein